MEMSNSPEQKQTQVKQQFQIMMQITLEAYKKLQRK